MVSIDYFPPEIQKIISLRGTIGSPHGLASVTLRENRFALVGYTRPSLKNWKSKEKNLFFSFALSKNYEHLLHCCEFISQQLDKEETQ